MLAQEQLCFGRVHGLEPAVLPPCSLRNRSEFCVMPKRVLVVDDDPAQRRILEEAIKRLGYSAATAESGDKALAALHADAAGDICLVLLDLVMPGTDGMAVLAAMRSLPRKPPAIVQTAHGSIDAAISAMRNGAVDFVVKPVSPERLEV